MLETIIDRYLEEMLKKDILLGYTDIEKQMIKETFKAGVQLGIHFSLEKLLLKNNIDNAFVHLNKN